MDAQGDFMYNKIISAWILAAVLLLTPISLLARQDWQKAETDEDKHIVVYTRSVEGSDFIATRGVTTVKTSLGAVVNLIADTDSFSEWMHQMKHAKIVEQFSKTERLTYTAQDSPWPVKDRDMVVYSKLSQDPDTKEVVIDMVARPEAFPEQDDYVRIPAMTNRWQLTPKGEGQIAVIYEIHANPGGSLPSPMYNATAADTPLKTLQGLQRMIEQPEYRDARMPGISEP